MDSLKILCIASKVGSGCVDFTATRYVLLPVELCLHVARPSPHVHALTAHVLDVADRSDIATVGEKMEAELYLKVITL